MVEVSSPDPEFEGLLLHIQMSRGLDFRGYKRASLRRRITLRLEALGMDGFSAYREYLEAQPGEYEELLNTVLINVTSFFRDEEAWAAMREMVIPAIAERSQDDRPIRIWSIGCASGEEPYSIAMLFAEQMGTADFCRRVKIYATDLDEDALRRARLATYAHRDVASVPPDLLEKYFEISNNQYIFERELRKCVIFGRHNIVHDAPISRIHLLTCRNLLIYLEAETQALVLPRLHYALDQSGYLFLGKAETQLARSALFRPLDMKHRIFTKEPAEWRRPVAGAFAAGRGARPGAVLPDAALLESALNELGTSLIVVEAEGAVALANLPARQMFGIGEADIGRPFQDLLISYRPIELRGPIGEVFRSRTGVLLEGQEFQLNQHEVLQLNIDIRPMQRPDGTVHAVVLLFNDHTRLHALQRELEAAQESLEQSIEELQSANEELETTNEELQSTNEELETTNEELQSTNEELETLNEEARSSNEEMESVNQELRIQAEQATSYRLHLESVLRAMNGGIVVIDRRHLIASWNRWSENAWGLRAEEVLGGSFEALDIGLPVQNLLVSMARVESGDTEYAEVELEGFERRGHRIRCLVRMSGLFDEKGASQGLVLVFQDVTDSSEHQEYSRYLGRIMERARDQIYLLDPATLHFRLTNEGARMKLGFTPQQLSQMTLSDVTPGIAAADLKVLLAPLIDGAEPEIVIEALLRGADGNSFPASLCMQYFAEETPPLLVVTAQKISDRKQLTGATGTGGGLRESG